MVWSTLLELPSPDVLVVYLDLNHWIGFAQTHIGHSQGASFTDALELCRKARTAGTVNFVLSGTIYAEMQKIKDPAQRRGLSDVMEELTNFDTLVSRVVVMECEFSAMLDPIAKLPSPLSKASLVGRGVRHAFGVSSGLSIMGPSGDETERIRQIIGPDTFDEFMQHSMLEMERSILRGPVDSHDEADLRTLGWNPEIPAATVRERVVQELEFKKILDHDPKARLGRLHDMVSARELCIEFQDIRQRALAERGLALEDVMWDIESARRFIRAMPSTEVALALKTAWHRNGERIWEVNDIHDIDALALAVPYCDIVVTEKACHHILNVAAFHKRMNTTLLHRLNDLPQALSEKKSKRI